jgi:hypothetical protein
LERYVLVGWLGRSRVLGDHGRRSVRGSLTAGAGTSCCLFVDDLQRGQGLVGLRRSCGG